MSARELISTESWQDTFMGLAEKFSGRSKDTTQVGCFIVGPDEELLSSGFNGIPRGVADLPERMVRPEKYLWVAHAEENAIAQAAKVGARLKGATAYVTHAPCAACTRMLIQAGIVKIVIGAGKTSMDPRGFEVSRIMMAETRMEVIEAFDQPKNGE